MKGIKMFVCMLASFAVIVSAYAPTRADYGGRLPRDQDWTMEIQNVTNSTTTFTVYYVDRRGLDVIATRTVVGTAPTPETFPKPGRDVRRVIIDIDPTTGAPTNFRMNNGAAIQIEDGKRLVFDTF
jgi:hypothetical protein